MGSAVALMAPRRLSDSEKQDLVGRYKAGESTAALAEVFGCSPNTVSRTVKALLPPDAYAALKTSRLKQGTMPVAAPVDPPADQTQEDSPSDDASALALDDADDFGAADEDDPVEEEDEAAVPSEVFTELVPLAGVGDFDGRTTIPVKPYEQTLLPDSAYMLVEKVVELDARPLREFPELAALEEAELDRYGICLYASPRAAKRQCGRSQRVIKVPDTGVFGRTSSFLLARGITRLVLDGSVIALDEVSQG